jgi:hypothetical protein
MFFRFGLEILRVGKKFPQNSPQRVSKEAEFCTDFKNEVLSLAKMKKKFFTDFHARTKFNKKAIF